jgi:ATP-dependent exoDNAse (exonuclease V) alpha subunit
VRDKVIQTENDYKKEVFNGDILVQQAASNTKEQFRTRRISRTES